MSGSHGFDLPANTQVDIRDKAMFELFYSSGLRLAEQVSLEVKAGLQEDLHSGEVRVTARAARRAFVPLGTFALAALQAWLGVRGQLAKPGETALFVGPARQRIRRAWVNFA